MLFYAEEYSTNSDVNWSDYNAANDKTPVEFSSAAVNFVKTVNIDSTRALVVYSGDSSYCRARIATISASGIVSFGIEAVILSAAISDCAVDLLDSTHAIVAVESGGDVKCIAVEFSGTTIGTVGSAVSTQTINSSFLEIAAITSTEFFVAYAQTSTTTNRCYYGSVAGTVVTIGSGINFATATILDMDICKLSDTTAVISYGRSGLFDWSMVLITKSGTAPVASTAVSIVSGTFTYASWSARRLSDTTAIACATESTGGVLNAVVITNTAGTLSAGTIETVDSVTAIGGAISLPDLEHAVISYGVSTTSMKTTVVEISGTTLNALTPRTNASANRASIYSSEVGQRFVLTAYRDNDDSGKGKCQVLTP